MRVGDGGGGEGAVARGRRGAVEEEEEVEGEASGCSASASSTSRGSSACRSSGGDSPLLLHALCLPWWKCQTFDGDEEAGGALEIIVVSIPPLTRFVRRGGRLGTVPEPDERLTSSSSYGSTEPQEDDDEGALQGAKDNRWNAKTSGIGWGRFFSKVGRTGHSDLPQLILAALVVPNPRRILQGSLPMVSG
ncbi:hypothetical protein C2845_PM14G16730 [Panicum miliaceum]|uniref:Uncharacterized protein n=1 Tax=Panicum miliaceum TaxID=4540 RepID=A0A3L6PN93_PANMI|nr:hypothetical protein C2845_PM14G16730 [Panicum miliaceum]